MKELSQRQNHHSQKTLSTSGPEILTHRFSPYSLFKNQPFPGCSQHDPSACIGVILLLIFLAPLAGCGTQQTSTIQPTPAAITIFWGFNGSTQAWGTSEGSFKLARVKDASSPVYEGSGSLQIMTTLTGAKSPTYNGNSVYTHTEATDCFKAQNFSGATASCFIYLPSGLVPDGTTPGYVQLFVKDAQYHNNFDDGITISPSTTGSWLKLSLAINAGNPDSGFDTKQVNAIGVRVALYDQSTLNYTGPFYLDSCSIGI